MWQQLSLTISDLEDRPRQPSIVAAAFRQLLRAHDVRDRIAVWLAAGAFRTRLRLWLGDLLSQQPSWDSKARCLEGLGLSSRIFYDDVDRAVRLADVMVWVLRSDPCGGQWAAPFKVDMALTPDLSDLASFTVHFGDRREYPGEDFQSSLSRIERELEDGRIEWAFVFRHEAAGG